MLKGMIILLVGLWAGSASAITPEAVCMGMDFDSSKQQCLRIVTRGYIAANAAHVCNGVIYDSEKLNCLSASLNKEYTPGVISICSDYPFGSQVTSCMREFGTVYVGHGGGKNKCRQTKQKLRKIERKALRVQKLIRQGKLYRALKQMSQIINLATEEKAPGKGKHRY